MRFKLIFSIFFGLLIHFNIAFSQPVADFRAYKTKACGFLLDTFFNLSTPTSGLTYTWDFGNGTISHQKDTVIINYVIPGVYTVKLTVHSSPTDSSVMVKTGYITIFPNPEAGFTSLFHNGCSPLTVSFDTITQIGRAHV